MDPKLQAWRNEGKHLPDILKDFHAQKEVFQTMHAMLGEPDPADLIKRPNAVEGQCYVIDCFLWFMARHGYTLQRSRAHQVFDSLEENANAIKAHRAALFEAMVKQKATPTTNQEE